MSRLFPETKPDLEFNDEGVCNACTNYTNRPRVDWEERKNNLLSLFLKLKMITIGIA